MGNAATALSSAAVWHSRTNAAHWARPAASAAAGSGPAPIVLGSNKATIAASEPSPGPQVPPTAGLGRATNSPVIAKAAPKRPRLTRMSLVHQITVGWFTQQHPSHPPMVGEGLHCDYASCTGPWPLSGIRRPPARGRAEQISIAGTQTPSSEASGLTGDRNYPENVLLLSIGAQRPGDIGEPCHMKRGSSPPRPLIDGVRRRLSNTRIRRQG